MNYFHSIVLGIVEGISEFLPISSTYHLITVSRWLGLSQSDFLTTFEVVIQAGAILALGTLYLKTLLTNRTLLKLVTLSFLPTSIVGFGLYSLIKGYLFQYSSLSWFVFIIVGLLFLLFEYLVSRKMLSLTRTLDSLSSMEAIIIGLAQALAVIPGVSRSGSVILMMLFTGFRRDEATRYTFLLSLPTILAASALDLIKHPEILTTTSNLSHLLVGLLVAYVSAYLVVRWFIRYMSEHSLKLFGYYRLILALVIYLTLGI